MAGVSGPGAEPLPGFERAVKPLRPKLNTRMAIARMLTPESMGVHIEDCENVSAGALEAVSPIGLWNSLVGNNVKLTTGKEVRPSNGLSYRDAQGHTIGVAVTHTEAKLLPNHPAAYARAAFNGVHRVIRKSDDGAPERAVVHVLDPKKRGMEVYLHQTLDIREATLLRTEEALKYPGLQRMGNEINMRMVITDIRSMIDDMIIAVGEQRQWTGEQMAEATKAVERRMVLDRADNAHIKYFKQLVSMLKEYNRHKQALFTDRIKSTKEILIDQSVF